MDEMSQRFLELLEAYDRGEEASELTDQDETGKDERYKGGEEASQRREDRGRDDERRKRGEGPRSGVRWGKGFEFMARLAEVGTSLGRLGLCMAWMVCQAEEAKQSEKRLMSIWGLLAGMNAGPMAVHRPLSKGAYPLRLGRLRHLWEKLVRLDLEEAVSDEIVEELKEDAWLFCSVQYCNFQAGCRAFDFRRWRAWEVRVLTTLRNSVVRTLAQDAVVERSARDVEKELSSRFLSYTGEEIPKLEVLTVEQVVPSLPPKSHGGAIRALSWVDGRTKKFLENPEDCVVEKTSVKNLPKLQARVHIGVDDKLPLAELLVERGLCGWTEEKDVFEFDGKKVLNGMFGVPKSSCLCDGRPVLRLIMNLIPSNAVMQQIQGSVVELPMVTQYLSVGR